MKNTDDWTYRLDGVFAVWEYCEAQHHKGLIKIKSKRKGPPHVALPSTLTYETHWGTERKVIAPVIKQLAHEHGFYCGVSISASLGTGTWLPVYRLPPSTTDDTWIKVERRFEEKANL